MSSATAIGLLLACSLVTYAARSSLILLLADRALAPPIERALKNVGPAVLAALTVNLAVGSEGVGAVEFAEVATIVTAGIVAVWRKSLIWTFVAGMAVLWLLSPLT